MTARPAPSSSPRAELLHRLATWITGVRVDHVVRVAVDGPDAAGKSTLADELVPFIGRTGREAVRVGLDGFHRPGRERHARGELDPEGYYRDSFDLDAVIRHVLAPLGPGGSQTYRRAVFDFETDLPASEPVRLATSGAVLLFDGVFLLTPELGSYWERSIFVDANQSEILARATARDAARFGPEEHVRVRYLRRYLPAQQLYLEECDPLRRADVVIENSDPGNPLVTRVSDIGRPILQGRRGR
jgi:uridine kinase